jgi:hypothetical protein
MLPPNPLKRALGPERSRARHARRHARHYQRTPIAPRQAAEFKRPPVAIVPPSGCHPDLGPRIGNTGTNRLWVLSSGQLWGRHANLASPGSGSGPPSPWAGSLLRVSEGQHFRQYVDGLRTNTVAVTASAAGPSTSGDADPPAARRSTKLTSLLRRVRGRLDPRHRAALARRSVRLPGPVKRGACSSGARHPPRRPRPAPGVVTFLMG